MGRAKRSPLDQGQGDPEEDDGLPEDGGDADGKVSGIPPPPPPPPALHKPPPASPPKQDPSKQIAVDYPIMVCPHCASKDTHVLPNQERENHPDWRRRQCKQCKRIFKEHVPGAPAVTKKA